MPAEKIERIALNSKFSYRIFAQFNFNLSIFSSHKKQSKLMRLFDFNFIAANCNFSHFFRFLLFVCAILWDHRKVNWFSTKTCAYRGYLKNQFFLHKLEKLSLIKQQRQSISSWCDFILFWMCGMEKKCWIQKRFLCCSFLASAEF